MSTGTDDTEYYYRYSYDVYRSLKAKRCKTSILVINKYLKKISEKGIITDSNIEQIIKYLAKRFKQQKKKINKD